MEPPLKVRFPQIVGVGVNYINEFYEGLLEDRRQNIKWLEVRPENYLDRGGLGIRMLDELAEIYPFCAHTISLSLGSPDPLNWEHLKKIKSFVKKYKIPYLTDHIATFSYQQTPYQFLLPVPWTRPVAQWIAEKARVVQDFLEIPFGLENIPHYNFTHKPELSESEFINLILNESKCHLLLDVSDVLINAHNYNFDPLSFIQQLDLSHCIEMHVAGFVEHADQTWKGQHSTAISERTFDFLKTLHQDITLAPLLFEWENHAPEFATIREQVQRLHQLTH